MSHVKFGLLLTLVALAAPANAATCEDPLLIDLTGNGVRTTSAISPVPFDLEGSGRRSLVAWTDPDSDTGILWIDLNHNRVADSGRELFGNRMELLGHPGQFAENGRVALAQYDQPRFGGNGDGIISAGDAVWGQLRVWVDRNHDGVMQPQEAYALPALGFESISLQFEPIEPAWQPDGHGNARAARGTITRRIVTPGAPPVTKTFAIEDVFLQVVQP